jgi:hypothetical protein
MRISTVIKALLAVTAATPLLCHAESNLQTGGPGALTATAHVDFTITIPKFLFLRVGTGTGAINAAGIFTVGNAPATLGTIDPITWALTPAQVGTGALPGAGGDQTGGVETAIVVANNGAVTLTSTTGGALNDGAAGDTISWSQITTTATHNNTVAVLQAPTLLDSGNGSVTVNPNFGTKVVAQDAKWAYSYLNATVPPAGTYGGVGVQNGRVVYTASLP